MGRAAKNEISRRPGPEHYVRSMTKRAAATLAVAVILGVGIGVGAAAIAQPSPQAPERVYACARPSGRINSLRWDRPLCFCTI